MEMSDYERFYLSWSALHTPNESFATNEPATIAAPAAAVPKFNSISAGAQLSRAGRSASVSSWKTWIIMARTSHTQTAWSFPCCDSCRSCSTMQRRSERTAFRLAGFGVGQRTVPSGRRALLHEPPGHLGCHRVRSKRFWIRCAAGMGAVGHAAAILLVQALDERHLPERRLRRYRDAAEGRRVGV